MKVKTFTEILGRMIDLTLINSGEINDFSQSSVIYTIYQSIAMELELIGMLNRENILKGIETGIFEAFDFPRRKSKRAYGDLTLEFHSKLQRDLRVSQGTTFFSSKQGYSQVFEVIEDYAVPKGSSAVNIRVYATELGTVGNVPAGVIDTPGANVFNIAKVYNQSDFLTGRDEESIEQIKRRFRAFVETRGRATNKSIQYAVRTVEEITGVYVDEETGYIKVYAHDGNGDLSPELKADVENAVENYRPSGIKLDIFPIVRKAQDLDITVTLNDTARNNERFKEIIEVKIRNHINRKEPSEGLIVTELIREIMNVDSYSIRDCEIDNFDKNIKLKPEELMRAGVINVTLRVRGDKDGEQ